MARAQRQLALAEHQLQLDGYTQRHLGQRQEWDMVYTARSLTLKAQMEAELKAIQKAPTDYQPGNDWLLYLISKQRSDVQRLISTKSGELLIKNTQSLSYDGHHPLTRTSTDYRQTLEYKTSNAFTTTGQVHSQWENAYLAAHEAGLLSRSIQYLTEQSQALSEQYAQREIQAREQAATIKRHHEHAQRRQQQITHQAHVDEDQRRELIKAANTFTIPTTATSAGTVLLRGGTATLGGLATALETAIAETVLELGRVLAIRVGQTVSLTAGLLLYSPIVGNGELTPEQRRRLFQAVGTGTSALKLPAPEALRDAAANLGYVEAARRIRPVAVGHGTEIHVVNTEGPITSKVPVANAIFDPATDSYIAETRTSSPRRLMFTLPAMGSGSHDVDSTMSSGLSITDPVVTELPAEVDPRIDDCIVCFPAESGLAISHS